ncbi:MAG: TolC family protein [Planctomycetota bacterium]
MLEGNFTCALRAQDVVSLPPPPSKQSEKLRAVVDRAAENEMTHSDSASRKKEFVDANSNIIGWPTDSPSTTLDSPPSGRNDSDERLKTKTYDANQAPGKEELVPAEAESQESSEAADEQAVVWPWWIEIHREAFELYPKSEQLSLVDVFAIAMSNAPELQVLRIDQRIAVENLREQQANFDWTAFVNQQWDDRSNPVGSTLDGVQNRKREEQYTGSAGLRRTNQVGGDVSVSQQIGHQNSNSSFFQPNDQGTANFAITYTQPLLRGGGRFVTTSSIQIATSELRAADANFQSGLQRRLLVIADSFWTLYRQRAQTTILWNSWQRAEKLLQIMEKRSRLDVDRLQILRAKASASQRYSEFIQARSEIVALQESLLELMYGDSFPEQANRELIPIGTPVANYNLLDQSELTGLALSQRPEIKSAIEQVRIAGIDSRVAKNQLLPTLGMTLAMTASGLQGDSNIPLAWQDQFSVGEPTYGVGFEFERPFRNRAALAADRRALLTLQKRQLEMNNTVSDIALEVRNAATRARAAIQNHFTRADAWKTIQEDMQKTERRFALLIDGADVGRLYLDNLLSTQDRLAQAELSLLSAQIETELKRLEVERASGSFLQNNAKAQKSFMSNSEEK